MKNNIYARCLVLIGFLLLGISNSLFADDNVLKASADELEKANQKAKEAAHLRMSERTQFLSETEALQKEIKALEDRKQALIHEEKLISKQRQDSIAGKNRISIELRDFYQKLQAAKIEHNMNRPLTVLGASGFIKELGEISGKEYFLTVTAESIAASQVHQVKNRFVNLEQEKKEGQLTVIGNLQGYVIDEPAGLLLLSGNTFIETKNTRLKPSDIALLKNDQPMGIPFDVTGGGALVQSSVNTSVWLRLDDGGVVVYPILLVGAAAVLIILFKFYYLSGVSGNVLVLENKIREATIQNKWDDLENYANSKKELICQLVLSAVQKKKEVGHLTEEFLEEKIYTFIPKLEKMMPTLNVLGVIAPLLGLLGTVTGMIATFDVITVHGSGNPGLLSKGISEALITTELGLMAAIPIILFHSLLNSRIEKNINDLEFIANLMATPIPSVTGSER